MAPRVGRKPVPEKLARTMTSDGVMQGVQPEQMKGSGRTVTVACKCPTGLILRIFKWIDDRGTRPAPGEERPKIAIEDTNYKRVRVNGPNRYYFPGPAPEFAISGGFAITTGVDRDWWEKWLEQNHESDLVKNKLIWALPNEQDVIKEARNLKEIKSGFEPLVIGEKPVGKGESLGGKGNIQVGAATEEMANVKVSPTAEV
jgi:hypothetical protein